VFNKVAFNEPAPLKKPGGNETQTTASLKFHRGTENDGAGRFTEEERELLVELAAEMMATHQYKSSIKAAIYEVCSFKPSPPCIERILTDARALIRARSGSTAEATRIEALELFRAIIRDERSPAGAKLDAQREINIMLGIDPRFKHATDSPDDLAEATRLALKQMDQATGG
jgi:hypothetical protein